MRISLVNYTSWPIPSPGLGSLIALIKREGHKVSLIDLAFSPRKNEAALNGLGSSPLDVVAISAGFDSQGLDSLLRKLRGRWQDIPLLIGGLWPTYANRTIEESKLTWVLSGESESLLPSLLRDLTEGRLPPQNPVSAALPSLEELPFPDFSQFDMRKYLGVMNGYLPMEASRGCIYECAFCSYRDIPYRAKSPRRVVEEILFYESQYRRLGLRSIGFSDQTFGPHWNSFSRMMGLFKTEGIADSTPWYCQTKPELVTQSWARAAAAGGCRIVQLGLESGSEHLRRSLLGKTFTNSQFRRAVRNLHDAGLAVECDIITGLPGTSASDDLQSLHFALSCGAIALCISLYHPDPRTPLGEFMIRQGGTPTPATRFKGEVWKTFLNMLSLPVTSSRVIRRCGLAYPLSVLGYLFNHRGRRVVPLTHPLTPFILYNRRIHDTWLLEPRQGMPPLLSQQESGDAL